MKKKFPLVFIGLLAVLGLFLMRVTHLPPQEAEVEAGAGAELAAVTDRAEQADRSELVERREAPLVSGGSGASVPAAPEALYAVNDPFGVISPVAHLVAGAEELDRRELAPDAEGRPGRLRLVRNEAFKYPLLRVEERFGNFDNGMINPFPEIEVAVADHVMLQVDPDWDDETVEALARRLGGSLRERLLRPGLVLLELPEPNLDSLPEAIETLGGMAGVRFAEPDWVVGHLGGVIPNDPDYELLWGLPAIQAPLAWEITTGTRQVVVAVIDSGVDYNHPDLQANIFYNTGESVNGVDSDGNGFVDDIRGWDFYDNNNNPMDEHRHGTHVAGTIAAVGNNALGITGVAWETRILPMRFLGPGGSGPISAAINAVTYTTMMGVDMTNNSWGGGGFSQALYDAIEEARDAGILFIAASGNSGQPDPGFPARYGNSGLPNGVPPLDNVISVAASNNDSGDSLASFSNLRAHIAAPGVRIYSTVLNNGYENLNGTSMASPHVAGAAALLLAVNPDMHYLDVKDMLLDHVDDRSSDPIYNFHIHSRGRLNINTALRNLNISIMVQTASAIHDLNGPRAGNGVINPGETVELTLSLRSVGMIDTTNVSATLTTASSYVTVTQGTQIYGDFDRFQTKDNSSPFVFTVDASTPTPYEIPFELTITAAGGHEWVREIGLTVYTSVDASGTVRNLDGTPFAGAEVVFTGPFPGSVLTGPDGTFEFEMVDGTYKVFADAPGFQRSPTRLHTAPPGTTGLDFVLGNSVISSSLSAIQAEARPGGRVELSIDLANSGNLPLHWQLRETEYGFEFFENGLNDPEREDLHWREIRQEFGGAGTRIDWWDLAIPFGNNVNNPTRWIGSDNWSHGPLSFNFEFPFFGQRFSSARVNNAGWLGFTSTNRSVIYFPHAPMPDEQFMDNKIAFQWALRDFGRADVNGPVHRKPNLSEWHSIEGFQDAIHAYVHHPDDHTWIFTWNQWASPFTRTPPEFDTGQIELRSDGTIVIRYLDYQHLPHAEGFTHGGPFFFSAGLQDSSATRGMNPIFRGATAANPTPGSVLLIRPAVAADWIRSDRTAGTLASLEGENTLRLTLDAGQLPPGVYESSIVIDSNDSADNAALQIPITFTVSETAPSLVLTSPSEDLIVEPGSDVTVTAVFSGSGTPDGDVEILIGGTLLESVSESGGTYSFSWENIPGGFHELTARVALAENGHIVYAPVREIQAGQGIRVTWESLDQPVFNPSLVGNRTQILQPTVISRNRVRAERFDISPVLLDPDLISWWGNESTRDPYGRDGAFDVGNAGREIRLVTNNFRKHPLSYTVTPNTILEFEFRAFIDANEEHSPFAYGIGLAEGNTQASNRVFRLLGSRNWGINTYNGLFSSSNSLHGGRRPWLRYRIPVGQHYTGNMQYLVFAAFEQNGLIDVDAAFRNIRVFESNESGEFSYTWTFNDTPRIGEGPEAWRTYFSPGTKEVSVTVEDGPHSTTSTRVLELPGTEAFRVAVNFQPETATVPAGFLPDTGKPFADRGNDLRYGWDSDRSGQTRDDNWLVSYGSEQGVTRIRAGNGASWRMEVPNGVYTVTVHTGASQENSNALLRFNGVEILNRNLGIHDYAEGSLTLPVSHGEIVISSHRNTASLLFLEINRVDDLQRPPVAGFTLSPQTGNTPLPVQFDASDSFDSDGTIVDYHWDFGNGFTANGMAVSHSYTQPGIYDVALTVTDNDGLIGQSTLSIVVNGVAQPAVWVIPPPLPPPLPPLFGEPQPQPRRELSEDGGSLSYTVVLAAAPSQDVTVTVGTGSRVSAAPSVLTFTPGNWDQPQTVQISAVDNEVVDGDEWVPVTATAASADPAYNGLNGASFDVWVIDNDAYGTLQFAQPAVTIMEDHDMLTVEVTRVGGQSGVLTAQFATVNGTALAGEDFTAVSGTLTWAHNDTAPKMIQIPILDDEEPEPPETFQVHLTSATNALGQSVLGSPAVMTVTLLDDDNTVPAIVLQHPADGAVFEAGDVVPLEAQVTSNTVNISEVRFYVNDVWVSTQTTPVSGSLYRFNWVASIGATSWRVEARDVNAVEGSSEVRNLTVTPVPNFGSGGFLREIFYEVTGNNVSDLVNSPAFPDDPDSFVFITEGRMEYQENTNNYGTRLRAYFIPPKTGNYHFYVAARRRAEVWLSTDDQPANRVRILNPNREDNPNSWGNASQRSAAIPLVAGQRYYLEALHKAATSGTRHIQVGVELPGGQLERPIPVAFLEPFDGVKVETSTQLVLVPEGGTQQVWVRLRQQPFAEISLQASLLNPVNGGESLEVVGDGTLTFSPGNWNQWQSLTLFAEPDGDAIDGEATLRLALNNGTWWEITAREIDAELNHPPTVDIVNPLVASVNLPSDVGLWLEADAVDLDNDPLTVVWTKVSGPGTVTFDDATALNTGARFSADGDYLLRVTVDDGEYTDSAEVTVRVNPDAVSQANITTTRNGSLAIDGQNWTVTGGGAGFGYEGDHTTSTLDSIRFAYTEITGDFDIRGRNTAFSGPNWSYTGLHVRNSLAPNSRFYQGGSFWDSGSRSSSAIRRLSDGVNLSGGQNLSGTQTHGWVRITRVGNIFRTYHSTDGMNWTYRDATQADIAMNETVLVGFAVHNANHSTNLATATWTNVTIPASVNLAPLVNAGPDATVNLGDSHTLAASFSGDYLPQGSLTTSWQKLSGSGAVYANPAPPTEPDAEVSFELPGTYVLRFRVSNGEAVTFDNVTITVESSDPFAPVITRQPESQSVLEGQSAAFTVEAQGVPAPEFQWFRSGTLLSGQTASTLLLEQVSQADAGTYFVRVSNAVGTQDSVSVTLTVNQPPPPPLEETFLINFTSAMQGTDVTTYSGNTWQRFNLRSAAGTGNTPPASFSQVLLRNRSGEATADLRYSLLSSATTGNIVGAPIDTLTAAQFPPTASGNAARFDWFDAENADLRQTHSFESNNSRHWTHTFSGFDPEEEVRFEFVLRRPGDNRSITITFAPGTPEQQVVVNGVNIGDNGQTHYISHTVSGAAAYSFRVGPDPAWSGLINAMAVTVLRAPESLTAPRLGAMFMVGNARTIRVHATRHQEYQLEYTDALSGEPVWLPVGPWLRGDDAELELIDDAAGVWQRFYRLRVRHHRPE